MKNVTEYMLCDMASFMKKVFFSNFVKVLPGSWLWSYNLRGNHAYIDFDHSMQSFVVDRWVRKWKW